MKGYYKKLASWAILFPAVLLTTQILAVAAVPSVMNFQAILLDDQGQIVPDSTYDIVFTIHPDSVSFPPEIVVWTELKTVETSGGLFNTMLGTNSPLTADVFDGERWLQMRLASSAEPFLPRTRIGTTPYSYRVESIDKSSGGEVSGLLNPDSLQVGRSGLPGVVSVVQNTGTVAISMGQYSSEGYSLDVSDELSSYHTRIMPDANGEGGYFSIRRNGTSGGFAVDGNYESTQEPSVSITGSAQFATFNMSETGSSSVVLPVDAIQASEMFDEPGVASNLSTGVVSIGSTRTNLLSRTIEAPADGFVLAIATIEVSFDYDSAEVEIGLTNDATAWPASQHFLTTLSESAFHRDVKTVTVSALFPVVAGFDVIQLVAQCNDMGAMAPARAHDRHLSLLYVPTNYGTVSTPTPDETADVTDPTEERLLSARANTERIEREMADMKARLLELERSMIEQESDHPER